MAKKTKLKLLKGTQLDLFGETGVATQPRPQQPTFTVAPYSGNLLQAVQKYLDYKLRERRMCPECAGWLPDKHESWCHLSMLMAAYQQETQA